MANELLALARLFQMANIAKMRKLASLKDVREKNIPAGPSGWDFGAHGDARTASTVISYDTVTKATAVFIAIEGHGDVHMCPHRHLINQNAEPGAPNLDFELILVVAGTFLDRTDDGVDVALGPGAWIVHKGGTVHAPGARGFCVVACFQTSGQDSASPADL